ncbi:hypothetical protein AN640_04035 [Candidatus Epulonipiscium fishelsonii]|uniref:Uncharacterized protein n=1 Tax=Candidatus Epulonipiscium fishelsonii TaxID=77094 RepID=A0ACC8XJR4_9FIRM|nr:hypothetical protein AN640_04035 [Epulopiscium sp. SCG-D08WGA-EpuloA1]OON91005.1 MAG: hypothetical protein ATN32_02830 [Epulopiscium sp. AS2M-Bin002]
MIKLNIADNRPIYIQIVDGIKEQIIKGILKPQEKLPSIRTMASMLTVTPNTISKAYQELEHQGIIVSAQGKGNFIAENPISKMREEKVEVIKKQLFQLCIDWQFIEGNKTNFVELVQEIFNKIEEETIND